MSQSKMADQLLQLRSDLALLARSFSQLPENTRCLVEPKAKRAALELYELHELLTEGSGLPWHAPNLELPEQVGDTVLQVEDLDQ